MINRLRVMTFMVVLGLAAFAQSQTFTTLFSFSGDTSGTYPYAGVVQDQNGNLYGTTAGTYYYGAVVYEVNTAGIETVLYAFRDGAYPETPVVRDGAGNLYGTATEGGTFSYGDVFKIDTTGNETLLYSFTGEVDGCYPYQGLVVDASGNLFGTTAYCGSSGMGTVFKLDPAGNLTVLHTFIGYPSDGAYPELGHLAMDNSGDLYGLTESGGAHGDGALYKLSKSRKFTLLHSFGKKSGGCSPFGSITQDTAGNLYGSTAYCGFHGNGAIWKVSQQGKETTLHDFAGGTADGCNPYAGVSQDSQGNLYGVARSCGANGYGTLYELNASGALTLLHNFDNADGANPYGEVLWTTNGTLFGTTYRGGSSNCGYGQSCGTVWSYVP